MDKWKGNRETCYIVGVCEAIQDSKPTNRNPFMRYTAHVGDSHVLSNNKENPLIVGFFF